MGQSLYCLNENVLICKLGVSSPPQQHRTGPLVINAASEPVSVFSGGEFLTELLGLLLLQQLRAAPAPAAGSAEMGLPAPWLQLPFLPGAPHLPSADQHLPPNPPPPLPPLLPRPGWERPRASPATVASGGLCLSGLGLLVLSVNISLFCSICCLDSAQGLQSFGCGLYQFPITAVTSTTN